ncbi:MAG TPA: hypothetical protein VLB81_15350 [Gaiellales bacterium]|nr:hypothetical protein [Gaiellales bacterium]
MRLVPGRRLRSSEGIVVVLTCSLAVACGGGAAAASSRVVLAAHHDPGSAGGTFVSDFIRRFATGGTLAAGGSVRLLSNGNVKLRWGRSAPLLPVRPWGRIVVSCTRPVPATAFRLSAAARGESALVQTAARRVSRPLALVPIEHQGSPITLPRSGPPQLLSAMQLSVATEALSVAGTFLVSVQWNRAGCESSTTAVLITHRS